MFRQAFTVLQRSEYVLLDSARISVLARLVHLVRPVVVNFELTIALDRMLVNPDLLINDPLPDQSARVLRFPS